MHAIAIYLYAEKSLTLENKRDLRKLLSTSPLSEFKYKTDALAHAFIKS